MIMSKHARLPVLIIISFILFSGCSSENTKQLLPEEYLSWKKTTNIELNYPIPGHEENYRRIFINNTGENPEISTINNRTYYNYPEGTVIIKEIYQGKDTPVNESPVALTAMVKAENDPRARGGWLWVMKTGGGERIVSTEFCVNCHDVANEEHTYGAGNPENEFRDYLFFPYPAQQDRD